MSIPNNLLAEVAMQDIINANSTRIAQTSFNNLFNIESMTNFYIMGSSSLLACHYSEKYKNMTIEDKKSQPSDDLVQVQK